MERLQEVLDFWFGKELDDAKLGQERGKLWFVKSDQTDGEIEALFGDLVTLAIAGKLDRYATQARYRLAIIILLDQFTRNIYRGKPDSFVNDAKARRLTMEGLEIGDDLLLRPIEQVFFYLPLEHSEEIVDQDLSVTLYRRIVQEVPMQWKDAFSGYLDYAIRHRDIIARFERFPHRNKILGRQSSTEEIEFLSQPGSSF